MLVPRVVETLSDLKPHPGLTFRQSKPKPCLAAAKPARRALGASLIFARRGAERPILGAGVETVVCVGWQGRSARANRRLKLRLTQRQAIHDARRFIAGFLRNTVAEVLPHPSVIA
jgi:hypothetical protein